MASIQIIDHDGRARTLELDEGTRYRIGRSVKNEIVLPDIGLSRMHAELYRENDRWMLNDCGSSNGTFANGTRIERPVPLTPALQIKLGNCRLSLVSGPEPAGVRFSDSPLTSQGTLMLSVDAIMGEGTVAGAVRETPADIEAIRRRFGIVQRATLELLAHEPVDALLPKILDLVVQAVPAERAVLLSRDDEGGLNVRAFHGANPESVSISRTIANTVLDKRVAVLTADARSDQRFAEAQSVAIQGIRAVMAVPLWNDDDVIGLIYTDSRLQAGNFNDEDLKLLTMLGNIAAIQIQNAGLFAEQLEKQRFEKEANAAAEIQRRLLPRSSPTIPGYKFAGYSDPCHEVGGDYYDCLTLGDDRHGLLIGDVAGKGMAAALLMAVLQATCHARAEVGAGPKVLVDHLNRAICRNAPSNRFVTLFYMDLDHTTHRVRYVNAGHAPPPMLVRASGETQEILADGPPIGIFDGFDYKVVEFELAPGDFVFASSDGVTDVMSPDGQMFGDAGLREALAGLSGKTPDEVRQSMIERLEAFARGTPKPDDLTIIVLQREA